MRLKLVRWKSNFDFRKLSHLSGSLTKYAASWKLKEGEATVVTSMGWHRLRLVARMGGRAVMIIPETKGTVLEQLVEWVAQSLRDGVVMLNEYRAYKKAVEEAAA
jgi:hypothetical protein